MQFGSIWQGGALRIQFHSSQLRRNTWNLKKTAFWMVFMDLDESFQQCSS